MKNLFTTISLFLCVSNVLALTEPQMRIFRETKTNQVYAIDKKLNPSIQSANHETQMLRFFKEASTELGVYLKKENLRILKEFTDKQGYIHIEGKQYIHDIPVYGADFTYHIYPEKERFLGNVCAIADNLPRTPKVSLEQVLVNILNREELRNKPMNVDHSELIYYPNTLSLALSYHLRLSHGYQTWEAIVDALSGEIYTFSDITKHAMELTWTGKADTISGYGYHQNFKKINVYTENDTTYMVNTAESMFDSVNHSGYIILLGEKQGKFSAFNSYSNPIIAKEGEPWVDSCAFSAAIYAQEVYRYYDTVLGLRSFDGKGSPLVIIIRGGEGNKGMDNSMWSQQNFMILGAGDKLFKDFARAKDVVGHEYGHGIVMSHKNLVYSGQPGAIHETYADIFGTCAEGLNWQVSENVILDTLTFPSKAMRDMSNPHNGGKIGDKCWQPAHYREYGVQGADAANVHQNSGLGNHAFYLSALQIGKKESLLIFYKALTDYLTPTSGFLPFRRAVVLAAEDLYGENSPQWKAVDTAFKQIGFYDNYLDEGLTPIADIYGGDKKTPALLDSTIIIRGLVSVSKQNVAYIQDDTSAFSGIKIVGNFYVANRQSVKFLGKVDTLDGQCVLRTTWVDNPKSANAPKTITLEAEEIDLRYQSMLINLNEGVCVAMNDDFWTLEKDGIRFLVSTRFYKPEVNLNATYDITGTLTLEKDSLCFIPRDKNDVRGKTNLMKQTSGHFFSVYPNPYKNSFFITGDNLSQARLYNIHGSLLSTSNLHELSTEWQMPNLSTGLYILEVRHNDGRVSRQKLLKQ